jgi:two-component system LytT family response regulator
MKAIIVDDEQSARLTLRAILAEFFKEVIVIGEADTPGQAVEQIEQLKPDVVFLDIQMQGGTGFDVLESIPDRKFQLIFISAHKQHAYDSFRFDAADYLLKPVSIKALRTAIDKVRDNLRLQNEDEGKAMLRPISPDQVRLQLVIPEMEGFTLVRLSQIIRCESSRNYTHFYLMEDRQVLASKTIKEFEDLLAPHGFIRIHKSHVINVAHLTRYIKGRGGEVVMTDGTVLPVSRERKDPLIEIFLKGS